MRVASRYQEPVLRFTSLRPRHTAAALALCGLLALPGGVGAQTWLLDTFTDDAVGLPPNNPEVGSVFHACTAGVSCDKYTVVRIGGNNMLHVNGDAGGLGLQWFLQGAGAGEGSGTISYRFTPLPGGVVVGANAFNLALTAPGVTVQLMLGDETAAGLTLRLQNYSGSTPLPWELLPLTVRRGQEIFVQWGFDTVGDSLTLSVDGQVLGQLNFSAGLDALISTYAVSNFATTASWLVDDVRAAAVPEPAGAWLLLMGLATFAGHRRIKAGRATARRVC